MRAVIEFLAGPATGRFIEIGTNKPMRIGRMRDCEIMIADDTHLSGAHLDVAFDGSRLHVRDLSSTNGTFVNEARVDQCSLSAGDVIRAGHTVFRVHLESEEVAPVESQEGAPAPPTRGNGLTPRQRTLSSALYSGGETLYAVLDAARQQRIPAVLKESGNPYSSLYDGKAGDELAHVAPYLAQVQSKSNLSRVLIEEAWGQSWGYYLRTSASIEELREHLRSKLIVTAEDGRKLYFRFYDPRILRPFLPAGTPEECLEFFGPISAILVEGETPDMLTEFRPGPGGVTQQSVPLGARA